MYGAVTLAGGTLSLVIKYIPFQDKWMLVQMVFLFAFTFATKRMIQNYFKRRNTGLIPVSVSVNQHSFSTMAFLDSGNGLYEPISGKPVSIIEKALLPKEQVLLQEKYKAIPFHAVGTQNGMLDGYEADYITIEMEGETISIFKPIIAITPNNVTTGKKYRMILHPDLLKESEEKE